MNSTFVRRCTMLIAIAGLLSACQNSSVRDSDAVAATDKRPFHGFVLSHGHMDSLKIDGKDVMQRIEYGFDYDRGEVIKRSYDASGASLGEEILEAQTLSANDAEQAAAFQLAREHPKLRALLAPPDVEMYGGFAYQEMNDVDCGLRTRCVHVFGSAENGNRTIVHAIIDLMTFRVVHPEFGIDVQETERTQPRETSK